MQHNSGVAVVATHLATTDRRALSQAWYSALRVAEHMPPARAGEPFATARDVTRSALRFAAREPDAAPRESQHFSLLRGGNATRSARAGDDAGAPERRMPKGELASRLERALARRVVRHRVASFAVRAGGGRVHILVRSEGERTRVVAVCAPPLRARVERALAHARFALAARGFRGEVAQ